MSWLDAFKRPEDLRRAQEELERVSERDRRAGRREETEDYRRADAAADAAWREWERTAPWWRRW
jgi:hypothetical protein